MVIQLRAYVCDLTFQLNLTMWHSSAVKRTGSDPAILGCLLQLCFTSNKFEYHVVMVLFFYFLFLCESNMSVDIFLRLSSGRGDDCPFCLAWWFTWEGWGHFMARFPLEDSALAGLVLCLEQSLRASSQVAVWHQRGACPSSQTVKLPDWIAVKSTRWITLEMFLVKRVC